MPTNAGRHGDARNVGRRVTYHLPLANLDVTKSWRVGNVTLRPSGWLASEVERAHARALTLRPDLDGKPLVPFLMDPSRFIADSSKNWATAQVAATSPENAHDAVRDVVAVLRLFQRGRTRSNLDRQTFGLPVDIRAHRADYVLIRRGQLPAPGYNWHGIVGSWKFDARQIALFAADGRFVWLEAALRMPSEGRSDLQHRLITALRFVNLATVLVPPAVRVALRALAMEALFRDDVRNGRRHRIARRIAYLTCGRVNRWRLDAPGDPHRWPHRPACFYLEARKPSQVQHEMRRLKAAEVPNVCTFYWDAWDLFDDRDEVMHEARTEFTAHALGWHEVNLDAAILRLVDWAAKANANELAELDKELDAFVARGVREWDTGLVRPPA